MRKAFPLLLWILFEAIAVTLWLTLDNLFYLFNFSYIGSCLALGIFCYNKRIHYARRLVQFAVGLYMLVYLGILCRENMQLEGFWYYLFLGVFEAAVIHYAVAKLFGPLFFGRGWCGYACWTAMVLDLLPFPVPKRIQNHWGGWRYLLFFASLGFVATVVLLNLSNHEEILFWSFLLGNAFYYTAGIWLAYACHDNRAFCKCLCPITVFLKPMSYFSLMRVRNDLQKCVHCGMCKSVCPMQVDMTDNARSRRNGTECILCFSCIDQCPQKALHL